MIVSSKVIRIRREMGVSHAEFLRILAGVPGCENHAVGENIISIGNGEKQVQIHLSPEKERRLGALRLPSTMVEMIFSGHGEAEAERFLATLDNHFRRGGG